MTSKTPVRTDVPLTHVEIDIQEIGGGFHDRCADEQFNEREAALANGMEEMVFHVSAQRMVAMGTLYWRPL